MSRTLFFVLLLILAPLALLAGILSGSADLSVAQIVHVLSRNSSGPAADIVWQLRLPRVFSAFACGGLLALAGVMLQVLVRNPLAEPYILGISGGSAIGALSAMLLGAGMAWMNLGALAGAMLTIWLVFAISFRASWNMFRLLLTGVVLSAAFGAVISLLLIMAPLVETRGMLFWLMGDLSHTGNPVWTWLVLLLVLAFGMWQARSLNVLGTGELQAKALGVAVLPLQGGVYFAASLATAAAVVEGGTIGFVGLIVPHAIRLLGVTDHRWLLPMSMLLGGIFLTVADTLGRTIIAPQQLPVGVLTAMLGAPVLLYLLSGRR